MANTSINSVQAVTVGAVVQAVMVLAVLVPTIQSGAMDPHEVENDPLAYTVYMKGSGDRPEFILDFGDGGPAVSLSGTGYPLNLSGGYKSLFISDSYQAVVNGSSMDVYCPDGTCYRGQLQFFNDGALGGFGVQDSGGIPHLFDDFPSYAYLTLGKSDEAKSVQTNALYAVGDGSTLNGSASLVMIGTQGGSIGVSAKDTVRGMEHGKEGGIIIDPARHIAVTPTSTATESPVDVGGGNEGRTVDEGHIQGGME